MKDNLISLAYEIEIQSDEKITLPEAMVNAVGPGRWLITIQPLDAPLPVTPCHAWTAWNNLCCWPGLVAFRRAMLND
jgi:hypothetical protein